MKKHRLIYANSKEQTIKDKFDEIMNYTFTDSKLDYNYKIIDNKIKFNLYGTLGVQDFLSFIPNSLNDIEKRLIQDGSIKINYYNHQMQECNLIVANKTIDYYSWASSDEELPTAVIYVNELLDDLEKDLVEFCNEMENLGNEILATEQ